MKHKYFLKILLFLVLYSALIFTVPQYVECKSFDPDELLDLFAKFKKSVSFQNILTEHSPGFYSFHGTYSNQHPWPENPYLLLLPAELTSLVILRC